MHPHDIARRIRTGQFFLGEVNFIREWFESGLGRKIAEEDEFVSFAKNGIQVYTGSALLWLLDRLEAGTHPSSRSEWEVLGSYLATVVDLFEREGVNCVR